VTYKGRRGVLALRGALWQSFPLLWVLQVVGSNPAAPTTSLIEKTSFDLGPARPGRGIKKSPPVRYSIKRRKSLTKNCDLLSSPVVASRAHCI
jgi:hypothetical protein